MPRAFHQHEEIDIRRCLREAGRVRFAASGVVKTSIEDLTKMAGIAKGSFYKFYPSKEVLFFELLEDAQNQMRGRLINDLPPKKERTRSEFERRMRLIFKDACNDPLIQFMGRETELQAIMRRVPAEVLLAHQTADQAFLDRMSDQWNTSPTRPERDDIAARISTLMLISLNQAFIGERLLMPAAHSAVASLADCYFKPSGT